MALETSSKVDAPSSSVSDFFIGKSVLITGATGFMGKVLVQKLLKQCPGVAKIFLLIRPKRNTEPGSRLYDLFKAPIFANLSKSDFDKVVVVAGDITLPGLGISKEDEETLIKEVSVVFHSAATVKFDEELTKSVQMNLEGTRMIADLSRRMANLKALVHVSTAYSHCYLESIEEKFYPCPSVCPETIAAVCRAAEGAETLQRALNLPGWVKEVVGRHPNTYTFTKALAEQWLFESAKDLPLAIVRPSIVVAAWKDPLPGWIDNLNGPTGMITGAASGILRSIMVDSDCRADIIPVDVVINLMIVVASKLGSKSLEQDSIPIYNCTSGALNPITWYDLREMLIEGVKKYPLEKMLWFPGLTYHTNQWFHLVCHILMHKLPAVVIDVLVYFAGHRPFLKRIVQKMEKASEALRFFSTRQWSWDSNNMMELQKTLSPEDKETFELDITKLNWSEFMKWYAYGSRHYVMKYDPSTVEASVKKGHILHRAHQTLVFSLTMAALSLFCMLLPFEIPAQALITCFLSFLVVLAMVPTK